jgi:hypothetical protein
MPTPNELTAWLALIPLLLVGWGMRGIGWGLASSPSDWFARAVLIMSATISMRLIYWDVIRGTFILYRPNLSVMSAAWGNLFNSCLNVLLIYACVCMMRGIYLSIPENERSNYNWVDAVFYPRKWRNKR